MGIKGKIHSFETFGTLDGPGLRFIIFLYGCQFRCNYCHNPDTWYGDNYKEYTVEEVFDEIKKYLPYIKDGGITVSGGEPLMQIEFIKELFKLCKEIGLHTTIDTNGSHIINGSINELMKYTDLVLLSIKHMVNDDHLKITTKTNVYTLKFAEYLNDINKPMWLRYVIIPNITNNDNDLFLLKQFIEKLKNIEKIELLPYHKLGNFKWNALHLDNISVNFEEATDEDIKKAKQILEIE